MVIGLPTGRSYTIYMYQRQTGTLYEFYIIGVVLVIAGAVLIPTHPAFLVLVLAGVLYHELFDVASIVTFLRFDWQELVEGGGRIEGWAEVARFIADRPWFGYGFGTEDQLFYRFDIIFDVHAGASAHNSYLGVVTQIGLVGAALFYVPFFVWNQAGPQGVFEGFMTYNAQWSYNSSIFTVIHIILGKLSPRLTETLMPAKIIVGNIYLAALTFLSVKKNKGDLDVMHKCFLAIAILFIINPVADPWYFCWVMPFLCLFPYRSWYLLSGLLVLGYLNFHSDIGVVDVEFLGISLIRWVTYVPFFFYLVVECFCKPKFVSSKELKQPQGDLVK